MLNLYYFFKKQKPKETKKKISLFPKKRKRKFFLKNPKKINFKSLLFFQKTKTKSIIFLEVDGTFFYFLLPSFLNEVIFFKSTKKNIAHNHFSHHIYFGYKFCIYVV